MLKPEPVGHRRIDQGYQSCDTGVPAAVQDPPMVSLKRYEPIVNPGNNNAVFTVSRGVAGLQNLLIDGRRSISAIYIARDMINNQQCNNLKCGRPIALTDLQGYWEDITNCGRNIDSCSKMQLAFRQNLELQNNFMIRHCVDLGKKTAMERIAAYLFECRSRLGLTSAKSPVPLMMQRIDIADYLGLRQETLSRAIAKMERGKLIRIVDDNRARILEFNLLRQIANGTSAQDKYN